MSLASLERSIPAGDRVLLDSSALIAYLNGGELVTPVAQHIVDQFVAGGRNSAIVSMATAMEILVRPLRTGVPSHYRHVLDFLRRSPGITAQEIDLDTAYEAARLRADHGFKPADALIVASGLVSQVGHLVTNDDAWTGRLTPLRGRIVVCLLKSHLPFP